MKQFFIYFIVCSFIYPVQTNNGFIFSHDGEPVPFASVINPRAKSWSVTDESGFFQIPTGTLPGDSLKVVRIGFSTSYHQIQNQRAQEILLTEEILAMKPVRIVGRKARGVNKINLLAIDEFSRKNALNRIPGTMIRSYGGLSGVTTVSMDGGQAVHTKITLDGIDLTNVQNGLTDLSDIPISMMQNMYSGRSPNILFGSGSFDGAIHIRSLLKQSYIHLGSGSFGYLNYSGGYSHSSTNANFQLQAGQTSSQGNYSFFHEDSTHTRSNNDYEQLFISGKYHRYTHFNRIIKGSIFAVGNNRGVAGGLSWPSPKARRKNNLLLAGFEFIQILQKGHLRLLAFQRSSEDVFKDTDMETDSDHTVGSRGININGKYQLNELIGVKSFASTKFELIKSTNIGQRQRNSNSLGLQVWIQPRTIFMVRPSFRIDFIDKAPISTIDFESELELHKIGKFSIIMGTGFHIPSFNDLYWPADPYSQGNPYLEPEKSKFYIVRWENTLGQHLHYNVGYRKRQSQNLIVWAPDENYIWKPQNLDKTDRKNLIISASLPTSIAGWTLTGSVTLTKTEDLNTDKALQYVPKSSANITLTYLTGNIQFEFQGNYTGERSYQTYGPDSEPLDKIIHSFLNINAGTYFTLPIFNQSIRLYLIAENILDKNTAFFPDYPEPGLAIKAGMTIKL
tara:strand:- start:699 stop:2729 length:2031 start_codon:yes stop_codon:yes gene_type:complete